MVIYKCDRCGVTHECAKGEGSERVPSEWYTLLFGNYPGKVKFHLCGECREKLHIPDISPDQTVGEKLLELIETIVDEKVESLQP